MHPKAPRLRLAILLLAATGTLAAEPSLEDRLAALEKRLDQLATENASLRAQLEARPSATSPVVVANAPAETPAATPAPASTQKPKPAPVWVAAAGKEASLKLGGYLQLQAETGGTPDARFSGSNDRFMIRRARLATSGTFTEDFSFNLQAEFGNGSIGGKTGYSANLTDLYVTWTRYPEAQVRVGQFKTPYGYEQLLSDTKILSIERTLPNDKLTVSRQIGAALLGDVADKRVSYTVGLFNGNAVNNGNNDNDNFMFAGRVSALAFDDELAGKPAKWSVGVNAFRSSDTASTFTGDKTGYAADTQFTLGPAEFDAEWLHLTADPDSGTSVDSDGWYALLAWSFTKQWQGLVRYETYDSNTDKPTTTSDVWTFGFNYRIKGDDLKLSLNYLVGNPAASTGNDDRLLARIQVIF